MSTQISDHFLARYERIRTRKWLFRGLDVSERCGKFLYQAREEHGEACPHAALRTALVQGDQSAAMMLVADLFPPVGSDLFLPGPSTAITSHHSASVSGEINLEGSKDADAHKKTG